MDQKLDCCVGEVIRLNTHNYEEFNQYYEKKLAELD